jgi:hypothetical protein
MQAEAHEAARAEVDHLVLEAAEHRKTFKKALPPRQREDLMSDDQQTPTKALVEIQALVRAALESADPTVMRHDLEMILTVVEKALHQRAPE